MRRRTMSEPLTAEDEALLRRRAEVLLPSDPTAWTNRTVDRLLATLDRDRAASLALLLTGDLHNGALEYIEDAFADPDHTVQCATPVAQAECALTALDNYLIRMQQK